MAGLDGDAITLCQVTRNKLRLMETNSRVAAIWEIFLKRYKLLKHLKQHIIVDVVQCTHRQTHKHTHRQSSKSLIVYMGHSPVCKLAKLSRSFLQISHRTDLEPEPGSQWTCMRGSDSFLLFFYPPVNFTANTSGAF